MKRVLLTSILIFIFIIIGTAVAVLYARGYRFLPDKNGKFLQGTGIMVVTSKPDGARVLINGHLTTATNNTINLAPGEYDVRIEKDGYFPWSKKIAVKTQLVSEADASLFPIAPKLDSLTSTGAKNINIDSTGTFLAFTAAGSSLASKNGIYILDMNNRPILNMGGITTQVADNTIDKFSESTVLFSPDGNQLIASIPASLEASVNTSATTTYLLSPKNFNQNPQDITATLPQIQKDWEKQQNERIKKTLDALPRAVRNLALTYFKNMLLSSEEDKVFYTASMSAALPIIKLPRLEAVNSTDEDRNIKEGNTYVYDVKEDRNYLIFDKTKLAKDESFPHFLWHPDSKHLIFVQDKKINIEEFDGQNKTILYAGPFVDNLVFPWPDGSSIVVLTNLNIPEAPTNLYRISLK